MTNDSKNQYWIGFDLGGTKMLSTLYNSDFKSLGRRRKKTKGHEGQKSGLERIAQIIRETLEEAKVEISELSGIGIGCPGPLDLNKGILLDAHNLGWSQVPLKKFLEKEFDCPAVIANDVDLGVYGESRFGAGRDARCVIGIFPGTGIGGGCIYEGNIFRGTKSSCMEIGHVQVMPDGPRCACGVNGCLEAVASRMAISAAAAQAAYRGQAPYLKENSGTDLSDIRSGVLAKSIANGDTVIEEIVKQACSHIGKAVSSLVHLVAPDVIILGGGLVEAMPELMKDTVHKSAQKYILPSFKDTFKIKIAELGDDAAVLGAAAWAEHSFNS